MNIGSVLPTGLTPRFFTDEARAALWRAYLDRNNLPGAPRDLAQAGARIPAFLGPMRGALVAGDKFGSGWQPGGPREAKP